MMDRSYCPECGAETESLASAHLAIAEHPAENVVACCRFCGYEIELRQPDPAPRAPVWPDSHPGDGSGHPGAVFGHYLS